ncbi:hypothetical protein ABHN84_12220 [Shewanella vesiculosa]|uniref:ParB/Sulfiredoxin domain-containing protein n=1 Tax=Shewanella vesiculosa TaxID=518738 RepID=A0ABV0FTW3_9GAMM
MNKTISNEQIDPNVLILDDRFQNRQLNLVHKDSEREASETFRQIQIDNVLMSLKHGEDVHTPLEVFELYGSLYVVDGFHRTMACQQYLANPKARKITVPAKVHRGYSEFDAYMASLTMNVGHGTRLHPSEEYQNKFKRHLADGENIVVQSKREIAKAYSCSDTHGLSIQRALNACIEAGLPLKAEWEQDFSKAAKKLKRALKKRYRDVLDDAFDKDNYPIITKLAAASQGLKEKSPMTESARKSMIKKQIRDIIDSYGAEDFRTALKSVNKELALAVTVKTVWDENETYRRAGGDYDF